MLNNAALRLPVRGTTLQIVGVDDPHTEYSDFERAYADACPEDWTLLLCHSPDGLCDLGSRRADLILCGHTHGGQLRLPWFGAPFTNLSRARGLVAGWYVGEELSRRAKIPIPCGQLYVSRGLGTGGFRGRLLCKPELPVFTLRSITST